MNIYVIFAILTVITIIARRVRTGHGVAVQNVYADAVVHFTIYMVTVWVTLEWFAGFDTLAYQVALAISVLSGIFSKSHGEYTVATYFSLVVFLLVTPVAMLHSSETIIATPILALAMLVTTYVFNRYFGEYHEERLAVHYGK